METITDIASLARDCNNLLSQSNHVIFCNAIYPYLNTLALISTCSRHTTKALLNN